MSAFSSLPTTPAPIAVALGIAALIAGGAYAARSLTRGGAFAALALGTVALRCSWGWGAFLIVWFVLASLLSRVGRSRKSRVMHGIVAKTDRRDTRQVLANGAGFGVAAMLAVVTDPAQPSELPRLLQPALPPILLAMWAVGALAAAGADTWATELGTLGTARPWSLRRLRRVPAGTSGAVSLLGTTAALAGAFVLAALAASLGVIPHAGVWAAAAGGFAGALADTLIGAWLQERRRCPSCGTATEQHVHTCGTTTVGDGGIAVLDNDAVNFACTVVGGSVAVAGWALFH